MNKKTPPATPRQLDKSDFRRLSTFIHNTFGIYLPDRKYYLLQNRLQPRLKKLGFTSFSDYVDYVLQQDKKGEEVFEMIDVVSTNKTEFFREKEHFDIFQNELLPCFYGQYIKTWSAGCSSGEEAYSLSMVLDEEKQTGRIAGFMVYGNDISQSILNKAVKAIYPFDQAKSIPPNYRHKYLLRSKDKENPTIRIVPKLRAKTRFVWENLVGEHDSMPNDFQFIFCRNTLIYFDQETQLRVVDRLTKHLASGGFLILGHSESLVNRIPKGLKLYSPTIYKKEI